MELAIQTEKLCRRFGSQVAVDNLSLSVPRGSVFGFLGPNGAGKTTTIRMLLGLARPSSGSARILGQDVTTRQHLTKVGFLPDVPEFYNWMRAEEFLFLCGRIFGIPHRELKQRTAELLEITGLAGVRTKIGGYSRGMKQRLGLAQALLNHPEVVFMDEPTSALDPIGRKEMLEVIKVLASRCTVFFSTHILADVERICDRVAVLNNGQLVIQATITELRSRYAQSALVLEVTGDAQPLLEALTAKTWTQQVEQKEGAIHLTVQDIAAARQQIPRLVADQGLGLIRLVPVELNLEDIFVRLVNCNEE